MSIPKLKFTYCDFVTVTQKGFYEGAKGNVKGKRWDDKMQFLVSLRYNEVWFNEDELETYVVFTRVPEGTEVISL